MYFEDDLIPHYECNCSKEKMERNLITIGKDEIKDIIEKDGKAELVCHFCNKKYILSENDLRKMLEE